MGLREPMIRQPGRRYPLRLPVQFLLLDPDLASFPAPAVRTALSSGSAPSMDGPLSSGTPVGVKTVPQIRGEFSDSAEFLEKGQHPSPWMARDQARGTQPVHSGEEPTRTLVCPSGQVRARTTGWKEDRPAERRGSRREIPPKRGFHPRCPYWADIDARGDCGPHQVFLASWTMPSASGTEGSRE